MAFGFSNFFRKAPARMRAEGAAHAGDAIESKASRAAPLIALFNEHRARWSPRDYATMAREGFAENPIGFRAVHLIAGSFASLPLVLYEGDQELDRHPLLDLLKHPNPRQSRMELLETVAGHLLVSGNAYLELVAVAGAARELHALRPDRMKVVPGPEGWPEAYEYSVGLRSLRFELHETPRPVLHIALFNPSDDHYGLSPVEAAAKALDVHNAASAWNKALLDNAARPSGALVYSAAGGNLAEDQFERLKRELEMHYQGAANAGRPLLLEGGLDWKSLSLSPKDMDFIEAKNSAAREIALAFGVPPMLLGIPGDNTYSNYLEANRALYRQTVLPLADRILSALVQWLSPLFGDGLRLAPDLDQVSALAPERAELWKRIGEANFLTDDEKRIAAGYGARPVEAKFDPNQPRVPAGNPDGGQWTGGEGGDESDVGINDSRVLSDGIAEDEWLVGERYAGRGGHHNVPRGVFDAYPLLNETRRIFDQDVTGPLNGGPHRWSLEHREYNNAVREHLEKFMKSNNIEPHQMSPEQAKKFTDDIKNSNDPRIRDFNLKIQRRELLFQILRRIGRIRR